MRFEQNSKADLLITFDEMCFNCKITKKLNYRDLN